MGLSQSLATSDSSSSSLSLEDAAAAGGPCIGRAYIGLSSTWSLAYAPPVQGEENSSKK